MTYGVQSCTAIHRIPRRRMGRLSQQLQELRCSAVSSPQPSVDQQSMVGSAMPKATQDKLQQFADEINRQTANCSNDANYNGAINAITKWNAVTNSDART